MVDNVKKSYLFWYTFGVNKPTMLGTLANNKTFLGDDDDTSIRRYPLAVQFA